jgi:oligoendopeptidase F
MKATYPQTALTIAATVLALAAFTVLTGAQDRDRSRVPEKYTWNLADIYPSEAAWRNAKDALAARLPELRQFQGKLLSSASTLADALEKQSALDKDFSRIYVYASMLADQDTRDAAHQGMRQEMQQMASAFGAQVSYIEPEILKGDRSTIERYIAAEPRLNVYRFYLHDVLRRAAHTLSDAEEKLLADAGPVMGVPGTVFNIL